MTLILLLSISGCAQKEVVTVDRIIEKNIPIVQHPKQLNLVKINFRIIVKENLEQYVQELHYKNGQVVFVAIDMKDYENLALNVADLKRYLLQQKDIILYYEDALKPKEILDEK